jgi:hypothetical protein
VHILGYVHTGRVVARSANIRPAVSFFTEVVIYHTGTICMGSEPANGSCRYVLAVLQGHYKIVVQVLPLRHEGFGYLIGLSCKS